MLCRPSLPWFPTVGCLPVQPPAVEAQTPIPGLRCASTDQGSPRNPSASANPPTPSQVMRCWNNPQVSNQEPAEVNRAGSMAVGLSPMRQHLPQDQLMPQHGSDVFLPEANSDSRREMKSLAAPGSSFSWMSQPFQRATSPAAPRRRAAPPGTHWKARNHSIWPGMSKDLLVLNSPSLPRVSSPCPRGHLLGDAQGLTQGVTTARTTKEI